jgi:hypothetical protein
MRFDAAFVCTKCGQEFTISLGPQKLGELRSAKKIGIFIGELSTLFAKSCAEHERDCTTPPNGKKAG